MAAKDSDSPLTSDTPGGAFQVPPFGVLKWASYCWEGQLMLKSWAGFQARLGPYGSVSHSRPSDGRVNISVAGVDATEARPLLPEQTAALGYLLEHEPALTRAVLEAIFTRYPKLQEIYEYDEDDAEERMPDIRSPQELRRLIGLHCIHIHNRIKDGMAYVGFEFGCTWDEEHGLSVLTHRGLVVEVGGEAVV